MVQEEVWLYYSYAFPSGDQCGCYRHETRNGNPKRCSNHGVSVEMVKENSKNGKIKLLCLDCFANCWDDVKKVSNSRKTTAVRQSSIRESLIAMGC